MPYDNFRFTENYLDTVHGTGTHYTPISFYDFMLTAEGQYLLNSDFLNIPDYFKDQLQINKAGEDVTIRLIEEAARLNAVAHLVKHYKRRYLGMADYIRWAELFYNRSEEIAMSFWAQVRLQLVYDWANLEQDELNNKGRNTSDGEDITTDTQNSTNDGTVNSTGLTTTHGTGTTQQSVPDNQKTAHSTRSNGTGLTNPADNLLHSDWDYVDTFDEKWEMAGDRTNISDSTTNTTGQQTSHNTGVVTGTISRTNNGIGINELQSIFTNKQFTQELKNMYELVQTMLPLKWLVSAFSDMFMLIY
jgi:hypothetical protein